jgi:hypothetical protein
MTPEPVHELPLGNDHYDREAEQASDYAAQDGHNIAIVEDSVTS